MKITAKSILKAASIVATLALAFTLPAFAGDSKGRRGRYKTVSDSYLNSLILPLSSIPAIGQAEVDFRSSLNQTARRSVIGFSIPLQVPDMRIVDKSSAEQAKFSLEIVRDSVTINECAFALVDIPYAVKQVNLSGPFLELLTSGRHFFELQYDGDQAINGGCDTPLKNLAKGDKLFVKGELANAEVKDLAIGELGSVNSRRNFKVGKNAINIRR